MATQSKWIEHNLLSEKGMYKAFGLSEKVANVHSTSDSILQASTIVGVRRVRLKKSWKVPYSSVVIAKGLDFRRNCARSLRRQLASIVHSGLLVIRFG